MRNLRAVLLLVLALLLGLAAAAYATRWIAQRGNLSATRVVVAAADIEMGTRVAPQMLTVVDWPSGSVPPGAFTDVAALQDRVTRMNVVRGDALLERKLAPVGTKGGLSAVIAEGKRAMTVRVNDVVGVAGFALPGNYVDVMVNAQQQDRSRGEQNPISMTVLEKVLVLAVAQESDRDDTKPKVVTAVTLELSPVDAEKLDLARSVGTLSLVLRNQMDKQAVTTTGTTRAQLLGLREVSAPVHVAAKAPARPHAQPIPVARECIEVIRNSASAMHCF